MSYVAFCLTLVLQGPTTHADLHDPQVDLFLEVPDVPALIRAYDEAPLLRILADDELRELVGGPLAEPMTAERMAVELFGALGDDTLGPDDVRAASASLRVDPAQPGRIGFQVVVDFATPDHATAAAAWLAGRGRPTEGPEAWSSSGSATHQVFESTELEGVPMWTEAVGSRLVWGAGSLGPDAYRARLGAEGKGIAGTGAYRDAQGHLGPARGATVVNYAQRRSPFQLLQQLDVLTPFAPAAVVAQLAPFDPFPGPTHLRMDLVDGRFVTRIHQADATSAGAGTKVLGKNELERAWYADVPPGVMLLYATSVDGDALGELVRSNLESESGSEAVASLEEALGFRVDELLARIGPGMVTYAFPLAGLALPQTYSICELRDAADFQVKMDALAARLPALAPGFSANTRDYSVKNRETEERRKFPVTTLSLPSELMEQLPIPGLSPSYAIADGKLFLGLSAMHLRRELKRIYGGEPTEGAHPLEGSAVALPEGARSVVWMDWGALIDGVVSLVRNLGGLASGFMGDLPFDPTMIPPSEIVTKHLRPTVHVSHRVENATVRRHEASFGPETWLALAGAGFFGYQYVQGMAAEATAPITAPAQPVPDVDEPDSAPASLESTRRALQNIRTGLAIYNLDNGTYPSGLDELTEPSERYPKGRLGSPRVPDDAWGNAFRYERTRDGSTYRLWSLGPNGRDEGGLGDDVSID